MASTGRYGLVELGRGLLRETRDGPGGRVSLPDHRDQGTTFPSLGSHPAEIHGQDNRNMLVLAQSVLGRRNPVVLDSLIGMGGGSPSVVPPVSGARRSGRGMRPARGNSRSSRKLNVVSTSEVGKMDSLLDGLVVKKNARVVSLSIGAELFSPEAVPSGGAPTGKRPESYRNYVPPREMPGGGGGGGIRNE